MVFSEIFWLELCPYSVHPRKILGTEFIINGQTASASSYNVSHMAASYRITETYVAFADACGHRI